MNDLEIAALAYQKAKKAYETWRNSGAPSNPYGYNPPEQLEDTRDTLLTVALSHIPTFIPMSQPELDALIQRNEERKQVKAGITPAPWTVKYDGYTDDDDFMYERWADKLLSGQNPVADFVQTNTNDDTAEVVAFCCNDTPEDDIDQLLALIADLQAALQDLA